MYKMFIYSQSLFRMMSQLFERKSIRVHPDQKCHVVTSKICHGQLTYTFIIIKIKSYFHDFDPESNSIYVRIILYKRRKIISTTEHTTKIPIINLTKSQDCYFTVTRNRRFFKYLFSYFLFLNRNLAILYRHISMYSLKMPTSRIIL